MKLSTWLSGGKGSALAYEVTAGAAAFVMAAVATASGEDVTAWHCAAAGMAGIFGAYAFINPEKSTPTQKIISILVGAGMASLLGPLVAHWAADRWTWVGAVNYYVTAAGGMLVGLASTPLLRMINNPGPVFVFMLSLVPGLGKFVKKD